MPRLNYGTLLENIVVVEAMRLLCDHGEREEPVGFATSFAMPPLTECWSKASEEPSNRCFSHSFLATVANERHRVESIAGLWSLCLNNARALPMWMFHQRDEVQVYPSAGPNGALLASMVAVRRRRPIHLWINDNSERYGIVSGPTGSGSRDTGTLDTLTIAGRLLQDQPLGATATVRGWFPDTIDRLGEWVERGPGKTATVRIGFLDPDNYAEGNTQVSSYDHRQWLRALASGSKNVVAAMFSGCQNRGPANAARNARVRLFHGDELDLYPQSLVFEYGNFQTGVKVRWPEESIADFVGALLHNIEAEWRAWHPSMGPLLVHRNGRSAT